MGTVNTTHTGARGPGYNVTHNVHGEAFTASQLSQHQNYSVCTKQVKFFHYHSINVTML